MRFGDCTFSYNLPFTMETCSDGTKCFKKFEYNVEICKIFYNCTSDFPCNGMDTSDCLVETVTDFRPCPYFECSFKPIGPFEPEGYTIQWIFITIGILLLILGFIMLFKFRENLISGKSIHF